MPCPIIITRRIREKRDPKTQDQYPDEGYPDCNPPGAAIIAALGAKIDAVGNENAQSNEKLIATMIID